MVYVCYPGRVGYVVCISGVGVRRDVYRPEEGEGREGDDVTFSNLSWDYESY